MCTYIQCILLSIINTVNYTLYIVLYKMYIGQCTLYSAQYIRGHCIQIHYIQIYYIQVLLYYYYYFIIILFIQVLLPCHLYIWSHHQDCSSWICTLQVHISQRCLELARFPCHHIRVCHFISISIFMLYHIFRLFFYNYLVIFILDLFITTALLLIIILLYLY